MQLLEREAALDALAVRGVEAYAGHGRVACVVAPAGVGKTSVLAAARERLARTGFRVLATTASEQERSLPHGVTRTLLEPGVAGGARDEVLADAAAPARPLFDGGPIGGSLLHALYWTVANLAHDGPIALLVDDAHWADDASLELLAHLARRVADLPVLVVVATRPDGQAPWQPALSALHRAAFEVALEPLTPRAVGAYVGAAVGTQPSDAFVAACHRATGGVPFYLDELVRDVRRRHLAADDENAALVEGIAPAAIVRSVLLRLAGLGPTAPALARAVAVLGDGARTADAADLAGLDPVGAARAADALARAGLLRDGPGLSFAHPILRAAVLDDIGRHERALLHARAARTLAARRAPVGVVAGHLLHSEPSGDPWVCATLLEAAGEAMAAGSPETSAGLLRRAQEEPPPVAEEAEHLFALGLAEAALGDLVALGHLEASLSGTVEPAARARRALVIGELARKAGLASMGIAALDAALEVLDPVSVEGALASLDRYWIGRTTLATIDRVRADRPVLDRAATHRDPGVRRRAAVYLALETTLEGTPADVDAHLEVALAAPGLAATVEPDAGVVAAALYTLTTIERHTELEQLADDLMAVSGRTGNGVGLVLTAVYRGGELLRLGRIAEAELEVVTAMDLATERGWPQGSPELLATYALACLVRGDLAAAEAAMASSAFSLETVEVAPAAMLLEARGRIALVRGDVAAALADSRRAGACLDGLGLVNPGYVAWRSTAAEALRRSGDLGAARALAEEELALARAHSGPAATARAARSVASTVGRGEAIVLLEEAEALVASGPALLEQAEVAHDLGAALRRLGRTAAARGRLATALDLAARCGATALVERARDELVAAGGRPRRLLLTGPASLTASERRVARLAAEGMTNTVIAQTLFISRKTVEKHLANVYAKLQVDSRSQLHRASLDDVVP